MHQPDSTQLNVLWQVLQNAEVIEAEGEAVICKPFRHFTAGTAVLDIWLWFESVDDTFSVAAKLYNTEIVLACNNQSFLKN
ncbi:hypothetical protein DPT37_14910 [Salmonella enterica subsp. enterica serovar Kingston]|uniref:Uncharacterized protein n=1 Tax=Salmonella enterica TaxID=28901 RepID=A0A624MFS8_SALER|nr:hypothetical protein [Salmonella enterica subsp. enterica serovar Kingston]EBG1461533.1 hypothetical protein [Salmonella enterica]ECK7274228.1 hypothetical protein [Salmonella enterica subsp. enterica serovar Budapest]EBS4124877.1 hypothetical protein [Salmonella enterica subsp. enterica serovar Kingston]ECC3760728.1 hypothetical protein [Salmonella enterica]